MLVNLDQSSITFGQQATIRATVLAQWPAVGQPSGIVSIVTDDGDVLRSGPLVNGVLVFQTTNLPTGDLRVVSTYQGDAQFLPSSGRSNQVRLQVRQAAAAAVVTSASSTLSFGQQALLSVQFSSAVTIAPIEGEASFQLNGCTFEDSYIGSQGVASVYSELDDPLPVGWQTASVRLDDSDSFQLTQQTVATFRVLAGSTVTTVTTSQNPAVAGSCITFVAEVKPVAASTFVPVDESVVVFRNSATNSILAASSVQYGSASVTVCSLDAGTYAVQAFFSATSRWLSSTSNIISQVVARNTATSLAIASSQSGASILGSAISFAATITSAAGLSSSNIRGAVQFHVDGAVLGAAINVVSGRAVITSSTLAVGVRTITATFTSANDLVGSSGVFYHAVNLNSGTTMSMSSSDDNSVFGQSVVFSVQFSSNRVEGQLQFSVDGVALGPAIAVIRGDRSKSSAAVSSLAVGNRQASAVLTQSAGPSVTAVLLQRVAAGSVVVSLAIPAVVQLGNDLPLLASVTASTSSGGAVPAGTVSIFEGALLLTSLTLLQGSASGSIRLLTPGSHRLRAAYAGNNLNNFLATSSGIASTVVNRGMELFSVLTCSFVSFSDLCLFNLQYIAVRSS